MRSKSIAVAFACLLLVASVGPATAADGSLSVGVDQDDGGEVTVTVTHNDTAVENASVAVNATDENATYAGEGSYLTDADGTVDLPAPEENVTVEAVVAYNDTTASTTEDLVAASGTGESGPFGASVSAFVHELLNGTDEQRRIGRMIADWVVTNNPGNAPDHAGPPEDRGTPAVASNVGDERSGNQTRGQGNETAGSGSTHPGNGHGPPDDRGPGGAAKGPGK